MEQIETLKSLGLFDARVPRYTSYPTAAAFTPQTGAAFQAKALSQLPTDAPVSVYVHIPFCERLCWFCACHTQGTKTLGPIERYVETVEAELNLVAQHLPDGIRMARLHWGGGTPTILPPDLIHRLAGALRQTFPIAEDFEFSVEIDPTLVDKYKIAALAEEGMTRASIGIQDFNDEVQSAIGRTQPIDVTRACVDDLRAAGVSSLNTDLVYGLPHQTVERLDATLEQVLQLEPDRVALFGYAHVPWASKRQKMIKEDALPDDLARFTMATFASERLQAAGLSPIGLDHFAKPGDTLEEASKAGHLRRNFQGYTADQCPTLIGIGASAISRFPHGYVQNAPATAAYQQRIAEGSLAGARGYQMTLADDVRSRAIERLMCDFRLDLWELRDEFGAAVAKLGPELEDIAERFAPFTTYANYVLEIAPEGRPLVRMIASGLDQHVPDGVRYSRAS